MIEIRNLGTLEKAFEKGLLEEEPICLIIGNKKNHGIFIKNIEYQGEHFLTTVEENCGITERRLYTIEKNKISYIGLLDAIPEDAERITKLKNVLHKQYYIGDKK